MSTTHFPTSTTPLRRPPRRVRPPFDVSGVETLDSQQSDETTDQWHARCHADHAAALLEPLDGVELGEHDRHVIEWLADQDTSVVGTVASLLYRVRAVDGAW
ncbi:hypothetical protein AB0I60_05530 [Actinosynnema sp. NPDC050436]|uniref:hypothetical protein n=1 Tax=Actinosynnema sp. NPDC050436 TaxID=3155659 RepID=UPI0033C0EF3E